MTVARLTISTSVFSSAVPVLRSPFAYPRLANRSRRKPNTPIMSRMRTAFPWWKSRLKFPSASSWTVRNTRAAERSRKPASRGEPVALTTTLLTA